VFIGAIVLPQIPDGHRPPAGGFVAQSPAGGIGRRRI